MLHLFSVANRDKWQSSGTFWQSQLYLEGKEDEKEEEEGREIIRGLCTLE